MSASSKRRVLFVEDEPALRKSYERFFAARYELAFAGTGAEGLRRLGELGGEAWFKVDAGSAEGYRRINGVEISPESVARNLHRCAQLCPTWVQTCLFALDGAIPGDEEVQAYLDVLERAGCANLPGVHLYGLARPSLQPEAERLSSLPQDTLEAIAVRIRALGLAVNVSV